MSLSWAPMSRMMAISSAWESTSTRTASTTRPTKASTSTKATTPTNRSAFLKARAAPAVSSPEERTSSTSGRRASHPCTWAARSPGTLSSRTGGRNPSPSSCPTQGASSAASCEGGKTLPSSGENELSSAESNCGPSASPRSTHTKKLVVPKLSAVACPQRRKLASSSPHPPPNAKSRTAKSPAPLTSRSCRRTSRKSSRLTATPSRPAPTDPAPAPGSGRGRK